MILVIKGTKLYLSVSISVTLQVPLLHYHGRVPATVDWLLPAAPKLDSEPREQFSGHAHSLLTSVCGTAELPVGDVEL